MLKERCQECKGEATWMYLPASDGGFFCDDCVPRSCECNHYYVEEGSDPLLEGEMGVDWEWVEPNRIWCSLDEKGRHWPCVEFLFDENGFESE